MIGFDEAVRLVGEAATPLSAETVALADAHGRVLAEAVRAQVSAPPADTSAMDGYAVRKGELGARPGPLRVIGQSLPGSPFGGLVEPGTAVRIFTGAPVPAGADWIVIQENVSREGDVATVEEVGGSVFIRKAGSDFAAGDVLLAAGTVLSPRTLVAAAAADLSALSVHRRPRLRLLATGDELAAPGTARDHPGAIPDSISVALAAFAREWGAEPVDNLRLADDLTTMRQSIDAACADIDLLVVTGGASVGERDFAKAMFGDALELIFSKVAMKPGKPVWLGRIGKLLVMGLPGNPTSALVTGRLLLAPLICGLTGRDPADALRWEETVLTEPLPAAGDRETFSRAQRVDTGFRLLPNQDSGAQKTLAFAELLVRRPAEGVGLAAGNSVQVLAF